MARRIEEAAPEWVWVVGLDPDDPTSETFQGLLDMASHGPTLRPVRQRNYGVVHLILLKPEPNGGASGSKP
ncbi:MAG: hypothetical protein JRH10_08885 [Deltaproteobacteria bacterium]|nr:hypothetical protein [Deltaproteobacteria bacterium]MBW2447084.1 hypothetical protein [Deltaproteobacteria bacterium]